MIRRRVLGGRRRGEAASQLRLRAGLRLVVFVPLLLGILAGCADEEEEVATDREGIPTVTPTAVAALPDAVEEATLTIAGGAFGVDELVLHEGEPTVLHVVNADDRAYRFRIVEDLVTATPIAADGTTDVKFTTPLANVYEGQLLAAEGDDVVDTVRVVVQAAGGVEP